MIDSFTIYCLDTGKPIAAINDDECGVIIDSLTHMPLNEQVAHLERLALASMRPSLVWLNKSPAMIDRMRDSNPSQLLAYLMNRLYASVDTDKRTGKPLTGESFYNARRIRIQMWQAIESMSVATDQIDAMLFILLDLDSRFNLAKLIKPTHIAARWDSWSEDSASQFIHDLWEWHHKLTQEQQKAGARAKAQTEFWNGGNKLTRSALAAQFEKVTPPSRTKAEKLAKVAKQRDSLDFLDQLEREMTARTRLDGMAGNTQSGTLETKPTIATPPAKVKIMRFGAAKGN